MRNGLRELRKRVVLVCVTGPEECFFKKKQKKCIVTTETLSLLLCLIVQRFNGDSL